MTAHAKDTAGNAVVIAGVIGVALAVGAAARLVSKQHHRYDAVMEQVAPPTCLSAQA